MASPQQVMSVISMTPELQESDSLAPQDAGAVTVAQLRARIEQQCSLISMLKQRNDETFREVGSLQWQSHFFFLIRLKILAALIVVSYAIASVPILAVTVL